ncbi:MAG: right-handed parallel beta-helix repeat-containing protein, partial [Acidimicrobiales bacterium]
NYLDPDDDGDGTPTASENADPNADGDPRDALDSDHDGQPDYLDAPTPLVATVVDNTQKISDTVGGLTATLDNLDLFGSSVTAIGDIDGDGITDIAVGAFGDDDGGLERGAIHIIFLNTDGTVKSEQKVSDTTGGLAATLDDGDFFGVSVGAIGDLDGDGINDIAVGAFGDDDGGSAHGAVHILFLNTDGTVKAEQKISDTTGGLAATLDNDDWFGISVAGLGDLDGDGINDIAVGAGNDDDGGSNRGAIHILFLNTDGTVKSEQKISDTTGGLAATIDNDDWFGISVAGLGDLDGDTIPDVVVSAYGDDDGGTDRGAAHILFLNVNGTVKAEQKISDTTGGLTATLDNGDFFGRSLGALGDIDGDGIQDIAVGATHTDQWAQDSGAVHLLLLDTDGTVKGEQSLENARGGLPFTFVAFNDNWAASVTGVGDLDGDGAIDLVAGATGDDDGGTDRGAVYTLFLAPPNDISGTVFEDIAGDVLADGAIGGANNPGSVGVDVHVFSGVNELLQTVSTDGSGAFTFAGLPDDTYTIAVGSRTVPSAQDPGAPQGDIWAEQTYGPEGATCADGAGSWATRVSAGPCYGGQTPVVSDGESGFENHTALVTLAGADVTSVDFGFSFNVVVHDRGDDNEDDDAGSNRTVQGSLRQFIQNANAISGSNPMRFVPVSPSNASAGAEDWWSLAVTTAFPAITDAGTTIDGRAYELADGATIRNTNTGFLGANAGGGLTVGVDSVPLPLVAAPELEVIGSGVTDAGFEVRADDTTIRRLAIHGFGDTGEALTDGDIEVPAGTTVGGLLVEDNVIGTGAASFVDPGPGNRSGGSGVAIIDGTGAQSNIQNNLFGWVDELGVSILSSNTVTVNGNEVRDVGQGGNIYIDALSAENGSAGVTFTANLIDGAPGNAVSTWSATGPNTISNNTITNVGTGGAQTAGVSVFGSGSTIEKNIITGGGGPGVIVVGTNPPGGPYSWSASIGNRISQNTFGGNAGLAIDLTESSDTESDHEQGDGVSLLPGSLASTGNIGLDAPAISAATTTTASGTTCANCDVEVYRAVPGAGDTNLGIDYGEGVAYLATTTADGGGNWSVSGLTGIGIGDAVSATSIDGSSNTSEFAANVAITNFVVNSTEDAGDTTPGDGRCDTGGLNTAGQTECTLRAAIQETNALPGADVVDFDIPTSETGHSSGIWTIQPGSFLGFITDTLTLDASTQPGFIADPVIQLDGSFATGATAGLSLRTNNSELRGFIVHSFDDDGLEIDGQTGFGDNNVIAGNWVGIDSTGAADPNLDAGIVLALGATGNQIGGAGPLDHNVIVSNATAGIQLREATTLNNDVIGNYIGVLSNGVTARPNGTYGVQLHVGARDNRIGGTLADEANTIAENTLDGILLATSAGSGNALLRNKIVDNGGLGIDLSGGVEDGFSVTANDVAPGDGDAGPNDLLNFPVITAAVEAAGTVTVTFDLDVPAGDYHIEAFTNPSGADASGYGEGEVYENATTITHTGSGVESFQIAYTGANGDIVSLTATEESGGPAYGSTSEFSSAVTVPLVTLLVNSTGDASDAAPGNGSCDTGGTNSQAATECTLRAAIEEANAIAGADTVMFSMPVTEPGHAAGVWTIAPGGALPTIDEQVTIDGSTQTGYASSPIVVLDGQSAGATDGLVLTATADNSTIHGLLIRDWNGDGIEIQAGSDGNAVSSNYIGSLTDAGLDAGAGERNTGYGVRILGANNTIGGATAADGNVISGNGTGSSGGIFVFGAGATIQHNLIGTDSSGGVAIMNNLHGLRIDGAANTEVFDNLISGNNIHGVYIFGAGTTGTAVLRNTIGTNAAVTAALPNGFDGVRLEGGSSGTTIGSPGNGNIVSGNSQHGVNLNSSSGNTVQANAIGTNAAGTLDLGNTWVGVYGDAFNSSNNLIGGDSAGEENSIAYNQDGVAFLSGIGNSVIGNSIWSNDGLGIDLDDDGVTANSNADSWPDYPTITAAVESAGTVTVDFDIDLPAGDYRIEAFTNPSGADPSGNGEGESYETASTISHTGSGAESFQIAYSGSVGDIVALTTTEESAGPIYGSTSEFSATFVVPASSLVVNSTEDNSDATPGNGVCDTGGTNSQGATECTLRAAIEEANALAGADTITFNMPATESGHSGGIWRIEPSSAFPFLLGTTTLDGRTQPGYSTPVVRIDGDQASGATGLGVDATAGSSEIRGVMITRFDADGVRVAAGANDVVIADNWIGSDNTADAGMGNGDDGIDLRGQDAIIDGNVVNHSADEGIDVLGSGATITGNRIGLEADGSAGGGNSDVGIALFAPNTQIGGTLVAERNVISMN